MINTTTWGPDTCKCVIQYSWDSSVPQNERKHTISKIVSACQFHQGQPAADHFLAVVAENTNKNKAVNIIVANNPELITTDRDGRVIPDLSKISFSFDENRKIKLNCSGIDGTKKAAALDLIDAAIGAGKVEII